MSNIISIKQVSYNRLCEKPWNAYQGDAWKVWSQYSQISKFCTLGEGYYLDKTCWNGILNV